MPSNFIMSKEHQAERTSWHHGDQVFQKIHARPLHLQVMVKRKQMPC